VLTPYHVTHIKTSSVRQGIALDFVEYGMVGVVAVLFVGLIKFLQKIIIDKLDNVEGITIKLIDRWNKSDLQADDRHERLLEEMSRIKEGLHYLKGKAG